MFDFYLNLANATGDVKNLGANIGKETIDTFLNNATTRVLTVVLSCYVFYKITTGIHNEIWSRPTVKHEMIHRGGESPTN